MSCYFDANGVAELDGSGLVPAEQLPSFVDDVIELLDVTDTAPETCAKGDLYYNTDSKKIYKATSANTWGSTGTDPEKGKIYVNLNNDGCYRWSGSTLINITNPVGAATESVAGIAEIATQSEVNTGTDDERIVTPLKLAQALVNEASATRTLTNKTFDANGTGNSISNIETADFASGVIQTTVRSSSSASDSALASEKAVATAVEGRALKIVATNPALTASSGVCTWSVNNTIGSADVVVVVKDATSGEEVYCDVIYGASTVTIKMNSASNIEADTYKAIIVG